jgi:AAA15 family ATPase/GTPase
MLIELFGANFGCFRDEFQLSLMATPIDRRTAPGIVSVPIEGEKQPLQLLRCAAIYGPNASGKSTLISAAKTFGRLVADSGGFLSDAPLDIYYNPFLLQGKKEPTRLGIIWVFQKKIYEYEIEYDKRSIISEKLSKISLSGKPEILFERDRKEIKGSWKKNRPFTNLANDFRDNALLLSLADRFAPTLAGDLCTSLRMCLRADDTLSHPGLAGGLAPIMAETNSMFADWLRQQLRAADIGVENFELKKGPVPGTNSSFSLQSYLELIHHGEDKTFTLPYLLESHGTKRLVQLAPLFYELLHTEDSMAWHIDELDRSLHPELLRKLIGQFNEAKGNPRQTQLIFTAHETSLLDDDMEESILRRDQVYLTEKDAAGAARLYSLAEIKENRKNPNIRQRYRQGRYGAFPSILRMPE